MKVLITGASGLVGSAIGRSWHDVGHEVVALGRRARRDQDIAWDPASGRLDAAELEGFDVVVHLAGESIAGRWTDEKKKRIRDSRVKGTDLLARTLAGLERKPATLLCASAIGFYGDRGDEVLTEKSEPGTGFLPEVCMEWEAAAAPAREAGIRTVHLRLGVVLSKKGGALKQMLPPFKLGLGGRVGSGRQYMSVVSLEDVVGAFRFAEASPDLDGPFNVVGPNPVTNAAFTRCLGTHLGRPTFLPVPAFAVKTLLGEMGENLLLASTRVMPDGLQNAGFAFRHETVESILAHA